MRNAFSPFEEEVKMWVDAHGQKLRSLQAPADSVEDATRWRPPRGRGGALALPAAARPQGPVLGQPRQQVPVALPRA